MKHAVTTGNMTVHLTNGNITAKIRRKQLIDKFSKLLKSNLLRVLPVDADGRTYIEFICKSCRKDSSGRSDSITTNTGYCGSCRRRNKHITKED